MAGQTTITALQEEIAAAQKRRAKVMLITGEYAGVKANELSRLGGYICGLQTAVTLLEKQQAQELPY